jgi:hypothetical protein
MHRVVGEFCLKGDAPEFAAALVRKCQQLGARL